jgi:hypothetical protein
VIDEQLRAACQLDEGSLLRTDLIFAAERIGQFSTPSEDELPSKRVSPHGIQSTDGDLLPKRVKTVARLSSRSLRCGSAAISGCKASFLALPSPDSASTR